MQMGWGTERVERVGYHCFLRWIGGVKGEEESRLAFGLVQLCDNY